MTEKQLKTADDERFGPMLSAMDEISERFDLLAGENIYMLTLLLIGAYERAKASESLEAFWPHKRTDDASRST